MCACKRKWIKDEMNKMHALHDMSKVMSHDSSHLSLFSFWTPLHPRPTLVSRFHGFIISVFTLKLIFPSFYFTFLF